MTPKTRFFVLTSTRSGSTWLLTLLNGQPEICALGEIFLWREIRPEFAWVAEGDPERFFTRRHQLRGSRFTKMSKYLEEVDVHLRDNSAGGFKLIISHLRQVPELAAMLLFRRYRMVLLVRNNVFESTVSEMISRARNDPHGKAPSGEQAPVTINPDELVKRIKRRSRGMTLMKLGRKLWPWPSVLVDYDTLVRDQTAALSPILEMLNISGDPKPTESRLTRRVTIPYRKLIANADEVFSSLQNAGLKKYCPVENEKTNNHGAQNHEILQKKTNH